MSSSSGGVSALARALLFLCALALLTPLLFVSGLPGQTPQANAAYTQNDAEGTYELSFSDTLGVASYTDVIIYGNQATLIPTAATGTLTTEQIKPAALSQWTNLKFDGVWSSVNDVKVTISSACATSPAADVGPLSIAANGTISLSALNSLNPIPDCIQLIVTLTDTNADGIAPTLTSVTVKFDTAVGLLVVDTAPETRKSGENVEYVIKYSVSWSNVDNLVITMPCPARDNSTYHSAYGQNPTLTFASATNGGQVYTSGAQPVAGVTMSGCTIYWVLGEVKAGTASQVSATFASVNGWENGVSFTANANVFAFRADGTLANSKTSNTVRTKITSTPYPKITKIVTNTIHLPSDPTDLSHTYPTGDYAGDAIFTIRYENDAGKPSASTTIGTEDLFPGHTVTDDLTNVFALLSSCGVANPASMILSHTQPAGWTYSLNGSVATWVSTSAATQGVPRLNKFESVEFTLKVDFSSCYDSGGTAKVNTIATNTATGKSANSATVTDQKRIQPAGVKPYEGAFATGNRTTNDVGIRVYTDDGPANSDPSNPKGKTPYGGTEEIYLYTVNQGTEKLNKVVMQAQVPNYETLVSATLPGNVNGIVCYSTSTSGWVVDATGSPPAFDYSGVNLTSNTCPSGWTATPSAAVKWVTFFVDCLNPIVSITGASSCGTGIAYSVIGTITVKAATPTTNVCTVAGGLCWCGIAESMTAGHFVAYGYGNGSPAAYTNTGAVIHLGDPAGGNANDPSANWDYEPIHLATPLPFVADSTSITGPDTLQPGEIGKYEFTTSNQGTGPTDASTQIVVEIPQVHMGDGTLRYATFTGITGVSASLYTLHYITSGPQAGMVDKITFTPGVLAVGDSFNATISLVLPIGVEIADDITVKATFTAKDAHQCQSLQTIVTAHTEIRGTPIIAVAKTRDETYIFTNYGAGPDGVCNTADDTYSPCGHATAADLSDRIIHYQLMITSSGDVAPRDSWIIDQIPDRTVFQQAYTTGTDSLGRTYSCPSPCEVWFASRSATASLDMSATVANPITSNTVHSLFTKGVEVSSGVWQQPAGMAAKDVGWIAIKVDAASGYFPVGTTRLAGFTVLNDDDEEGPATEGSKAGRTLYNTVAQVSKDTLLAIG
ncbi:MAG: hypothetical protein LBR20_01220, partial [Propionibacteriaceae bacterium]|nr:hypothetical protein [Propionibacteriaceae bacterium]